MTILLTPKSLQLIDEAREHEMTIIGFFNECVFIDADFVAAEAPDIELNAENKPETISTSTPSTATISQQTLIIILSASDPKAATCNALNFSTVTPHNIPSV